MNYFGDDYEDSDYRLEFSKDKRHRLKLSLPADVHLPNKNEAKLLRKIKAETGMNEKEIRSIYKYRKMLSDASKKEGSKTERERRLIWLMKSITKELKLPKEHPIVLEKFWNKINEIRNRRLNSYYTHSISSMSNEEIMRIVNIKRKP